MEKAKKDEDFIMVRVRRGVLNRFRMILAKDVEEANGKTVYLHETMQKVADKELEARGIKYKPVTSNE